MQMNNELIKQIIELEKNHEEEKISDILEEKLKHDPNNIDLLFRLAMLNVFMPFVDYPTTLILIEKVISVCKKYDHCARILLRYNDYSFSTIKQVCSWIFAGKDLSLTMTSVKPIIEQILADGTNQKIQNDAKQIIEMELKHDPENLELLFLLVFVETGKDIDKLLKTIIKTCKETEAIATIFFAYIVIVGYFIDDELLDRLNNIHTNNPEINSMLKYVISWYYWLNNNDTLEEKYLKESIELYQGHVQNYKHLAMLYKKQGRDTEADELIKKAQSNVKKVYGAEDWDSTDVNEYLGELVKGIYVTSMGSVRL